MKQKKRIAKTLLNKIVKSEKEGYTVEHGKKQEKTIKRISTSAKPTKEEREIARTLSEAALNDYDEVDENGDPIRKFRIRHLKKIQEKVDISIVYGKKGIGKTVQLGRYLKELFDSEPSAMVFFIRSTAMEMAAIDAMMSTSDDWPCYIQTNKIYHKTQKRKGYPRHVGFITYASGSGLQKGKGPDYKDIRAIIGDECNTETDEFTLNRAVILKFINFVSSVVRDKENVEVYMFGNLIRNNDGTVTNSLLRLLGVDQDSEVKLIKAESLDRKKTTTLLYWNSGKHYDGFEKEKLVTMFQTLDVQEFETNRPLPISSKILSDAEFVNCHPIGAWVFTMDDEIFVLYFGYFIYEESPDRVPVVRPGNYYVLRIEEFDPFVTYKYYLSSDEVAIKNFLKKKIEHIEEEEVADYLEDIYDICSDGNMFYGSEMTDIIFRKFMKKGTQKYKLTGSDRESF